MEVEACGNAALILNKALTLAVLRRFAEQNKYRRVGKAVMPTVLSGPGPIDVHPRFQAE